MPRRSTPIVERALDLLKLSRLLFLKKMGKPINPRLLFLKKSRKRNLLEHYNYAFVREYEFSPSRTPLFQQYKRRRSLKKRNACNVYSMLFLSRRGRVERGEFEVEGEESFALETLPSIGNGLIEDLSSDLVDEEDYSVDQRAEIFIQRFYEDMNSPEDEIGSAVQRFGCG